jgi:hypothetical protein
MHFDPESGYRIQFEAALAHRVKETLGKSPEIHPREWADFKSNLLIYLVKFTNPTNGSWWM